MDIKETFLTQGKHDILLYNAAYYKFIFKKTEKIVCAVFYIVNESEKKRHDTVSESLKIVAKKTLDEVITTLSYTSRELQEKLQDLSASYVALQSNMRVAHASGTLDLVVVDMLCLEIDLVLKTLRSFSTPSVYNPFDLSVESATGDVQKEARVPAARISTASQTFSQDTVKVRSLKEDNKGQTTGRRQTIKDILATHGNATIKDISAKIQDCSEKTLQRELISMIKDGLVHKEGERRWSRYSLV